MICSSLNRFFMSNLLHGWDWTLRSGATQIGGTSAARRYVQLAVTAKIGGRGLPTPDGYIAAFVASHGLIVASRGTASYEAASITVINPWEM